MKTDKRPEASPPEPTKTMEQVVQLLGWAYQGWKQGEQAKNEYKDAFFSLADQELGRQQRAVKLVTFPASSDKLARTRAELHHPGWIVDDARPHPKDEGVFEVILAEDLSLRPYSYEHTGIRYARTVSKGPVLIDDDWLQEENPELYERVTYKLPWGQRIVIPIEHLDSATIGALSKYIYNGKPRVSLAAPREIKEGE